MVLNNYQAFKKTEILLNADGKCTDDKPSRERILHFICFELPARLVTFSYSMIVSISLLICSHILLVLDLCVKIRHTSLYHVSVD